MMIFNVPGNIQDIGLILYGRIADQLATHSTFPRPLPFWRIFSYHRLGSDCDQQVKSKYFEGSEKRCSWRDITDLRWRQTGAAGKFSGFLVFYCSPSIGADESRWK
jgi:hypothetical protein